MRTRRNVWWGAVRAVRWRRARTVRVRVIYFSYSLQDWTPSRAKRTRVTRPCTIFVVGRRRCDRWDIDACGENILGTCTRVRRE